MSSRAPVSFADLLEAYEWISSNDSADCRASVCIGNGKEHLISSDSAFEFDTDDDDSEEDVDVCPFIHVPNKYELNLGNNLPFGFIEEAAPDLSDESVVPSIAAEHPADLRR